MLYEIRVAVDRPGKDGNLKNVKDHFILDAELHGEAETVGFKLYNDGMFEGENPDVVSVSRSAIHEIINQKEEGKPFFNATVVDIVTDDNGAEKEMKYQLLVCAHDLLAATDIVAEYIRQGYNMRLDSIRRTKIVDYIPYDKQ